MPAINARDGAQIFYKDWGTGQPIVFSHGWPLNADAWDEQLHFLAAQGYRAIAHDRRGHGRSTQTWTGNDMDTYADDLAALVESLTGPIFESDLAESGVAAGTGYALAATAKPLIGVSTRALRGLASSDRVHSRRV